MQNIINIIILILLMYILFRLPSMEQMSNVDKATEDKIRTIYKIDTDAIRNLSNLAKDLTVNGKLTVPGGLDLKGAFNIIPKGVIVAWNGATAPVGWALCNGSNGTPDLRGRFILGLGHGSGLTNRLINQRGGSETHILTVAEMPAHTGNGTTSTDGNHHHPLPITGNGNHGVWGISHAGLSGYSGGHSRITQTNGNHNHTFSFTTANTGGNGAHNNMPPYHFYLMRVLIK